MREVKVALNENSYQVKIDDGITDKIVPVIEENNLYKNLLVVTDGNVEKLHSVKIKNAFKGYKNKVNFYTLPPGEYRKSYKELNKIYSYLLDKGYNRDTLIIAIGGGVTGDLVGFAASTFLRGVQLIHVPTTLLAAVDSSIGGKTGINFKKKKNMVGSFYQPKHVLIDTEFINTLNKNEINCGIGEIVKYAFLSGEKLYDFVIQNLPNIYAHKTETISAVIFESASIKASVVGQDEKESGVRKILNLGHTFAHAYESALNFKIKHGEAVIAGITAALTLSYKLGILDKTGYEQLLELPLSVKINGEKIRGLNNKELLDIMKLDKKSKSGTIKFVLIKSLGEILIDAEAGNRDIYYALNKTEKLLGRK